MSFPQTRQFPINFFKWIESSAEEAEFYKSDVIDDGENWQ